MPELKPCPFCGGKMRLLRKDPLKIGIVMDCTECYIRVAVPWAYDVEHGIPAFNKRASGWIPCSGRMPGDGQRVLICTGIQKIFVAAYDRSSDMFLQRVHEVIHAWCRCEVTHWMPLPEPPEKEGNNEQ